MTPKRPLATCLMAELKFVPKRSEFSPPSPLLLIAPTAFMALAMHSCASGLREPRLIAPETNFFMMLSTLSTSFTEIARTFLNWKRPRSVHRRCAWSSIRRLYSLNLS